MTATGPWGGWSWTRFGCVRWLVQVGAALERACDVVCEAIRSVVVQLGCVRRRW